MNARHRPPRLWWTDAVGAVMAQALVLSLVALGLVVALWKEAFLPAKYFNDSRNLQELMVWPGREPENAFTRMSYMYNAMGPLGTPGAVSTGTYLLAVLVLFCCVPLGRMRHFGPVAVGMVGFTLVTTAIYLAQYSKESLVLVIVLGVVMSPPGRGWLLLHGAGMGLYAWWVRPYWGLTAAAYVLLTLLLPRLKSLRPLVVPVLLAYGALALATTAVLGTELTSFRANVNEGRVGAGEANTMIVDLLPGTGPAISTANIVIDGLSLVVPWPMILAKNPIYLVFGTVIAGLWIVFFRRVEGAAAHGLLRRDPRLVRAAALLIAVVCVQAVFEPDYGSYIKHLCPLLGLFALVFDRTGEGARSPGGGATDRSPAGG